MKAEDLTVLLETGEKSRMRYARYSIQFPYSDNAGNSRFFGI